MKQIGIATDAHTKKKKQNKNGDAHNFFAPSLHLRFPAQSATCSQSTHKKSQYPNYIHGKKNCETTQPFRIKYVYILKPRVRSEERRVGKEWRARRSAVQIQK